MQGGVRGRGGHARAGKAEGRDAVLLVRGQEVAGAGGADGGGGGGGGGGRGGPAEVGQRGELEHGGVGALAGRGRLRGGRGLEVHHDVGQLRRPCLPAGRLHVAGAADHGLRLVAAVVHVGGGDGDERARPRPTVPDTLPAVPNSAPVAPGAAVQHELRRGQGVLRVRVHAKDAQLPRAPQGARLAAPRQVLRHRAAAGEHRGHVHRGRVHDEGG